MLPAEVRRAVGSYLGRADRLLPGRVVGAYVFGSTALGAYRPGRSDIDLLVVLDDAAVTAADRRRLRALHLAQTPRMLAGLARTRRLFAMCNAVFVHRADLSLPVTRIVPVASHVGHEFTAGAGFDVNPVMWQVLATRGMTVRGPKPAELDLDPEPDHLREWNLANLRDYWAAQAERLAVGGRPIRAAAVEWNVLGPLRLHATIATGAVLSKQEAGAYGIRAFGRDVEPIVAVALASLTGHAPPAAPPREHWRVSTADLMNRVIEDAAGL
ncbi:nucleotidyltransferase domain-containing protein [Occultella glacieicola]|uniref:Nucleotidyltransferase domain-containing protein n=1 Tax=Occultella glacieicola TaxID=2518684 RepID=A0ABY2E0D3_9MICO|nr:nucleotidyltransferase domain-containing protein [Occultella glacieicola]TDE90863.1 nucleotidyltransferase domain-containing protein [Occultella glacieicola]